MAKYAAALDQGTTSTRCMIFDHGGQVVSRRAEGARADLSQAGLGRARRRRRSGRARRRSSTRRSTRPARAPTTSPALGITNQRETTVVWDRNTGEPVHNALVWQDTRTDKLVDELLARRRPGPLPRAGRPAAGDLLLRAEGPLDARQRRRRARARRGRRPAVRQHRHLVHLEPHGRHRRRPAHHRRDERQPHAADGPRDARLGRRASPATIGVPRRCCPRSAPSSEVYGEVSSGGAFTGVPIAGDLGDQQAATFGQTCFSPGEAKNTYGTGNFLLLNTGTEAVQSKTGLLTTVGYKIGDNDADLLPRGLDRDHRRARAVAARQPQDDQGGARGRGARRSRSRTTAACYIVPAFSGLFAPYWKSNARGVFAGLTRYVNAGHIARATLEATAYQSREVVEAMNAGLGRRRSSR